MSAHIPEPAPIYENLTGTSGGRAFWTRSTDGARLRTAIWDGGNGGTVLLFPGRTEYIEKYGAMITRLQARGLNVVVFDWRGQGLSARPEHDRNMGDIVDFSVYQTDLQRILKNDEIRSLPGPRYLFAHSMGGCIALRALVNGLDVRAVVLSAPMFGFPVSRQVVPLARGIIHSGHRIGFGLRYAPGTTGNFYVQEQPFEGNVLTSSPRIYAEMKRQLKLHPELGLGGPGIRWVSEALHEMADLMRQPLPGLPILTFMGNEEAVVSPEDIMKQVARMPNGRLVTCTGARHEIWMETDKIQKPVWQETDAFLEHLAD